MKIDRRLKILMTGSLAVFCGLIAVGNIHDPETNFQFVKHVLSMDTVLPSSTMATHALPVPILWTVGFWLIVIGEATTAVLFALGTFELFRARNFTAREFHHAKRFIFIAAGCAFLIWFVGFIAVGGEWFAMWQSQVWNGQQAAFRFIASILLILIYVAQPDPEL